MLAGALALPRGRTLVRALALGLAAIALAACVPITPPPPPPPPPPPTYGPNPPVMSADFPDPMVAPTPTGVAAYATNQLFGSRIPTATATSLAQWTPGPDALPSQPAWANPQALAPYWAPAVHQFGSTWVMYFTGPSAAFGRQCIGVATAANPLGPYAPVNTAPIMCQPTLGGSIDPSVVIDAAGMPWLLWKSDGNCCELPVYVWSQRLATDGLGLAAGTSANAILGVDQGWEDGSSGGAQPWKRLVEAPAMIEDGGVYWLFYSASWWESVNYAVGFARCTSPAGGCVKPRNGPILKGSLQGAGPGGEETFREANGQKWLVYHAWAFAAPSYPSNSRTMRLSRLSFANGEPVLGSGP